MLRSLFWSNVLSRVRDARMRWREANGECYPVSAHKRDRWALQPHRRDSVSRLVRFQSRLARERAK
jgi:hypothetical protein